MSRHVLIADDESLLLEALGQLLELEGYRVSTAPDGRTALQMAEQTAFDAILLDVKMPGMTGLDVLAVLQATMPKIPTIMMSGQADPSVVKDALKSGARDFIMKPFNDDRLLAAVKRAVETAG